MNPWLALLLAVAAGMLAGLVTGLFHTACGIPAILSGILTQLALYSLNLRIMGLGSESTTRATVALSVDNQDLLISSRYVRDLSLENPLILLALAVIVVIGVLYWFFGTEMGCSLRATGANTNMARAQGINTDFAKVLALVVSNGLVALSGALIAQYQGSATIDMGRGAIVIGLAAVIIGEVLFSKCFINFALKLLAAVIGAIIYYMVISLVLRMGLESTDLKLLTALVVAVFLTVPYLSGKRAAKARK
jgi:putative ABC transport system permease protein